MEDIYGYEIKNLSGEDHFLYSPTKSAEYYLVFLIWNFEPFYYDFVVNGEVVTCEWASHSPSINSKSVPFSSISLLNSLRVRTLSA